MADEPMEPEVLDPEPEPGMGEQLADEWRTQQAERAGVPRDGVTGALVPMRPGIGLPTAPPGERSPAEMTNDQLRCALEETRERYEIRNAFLREWMKAGVDYGMIHRKYKEHPSDTKWSECPNAGLLLMVGPDGDLCACPVCGAQHTLWKSGAEKILQFNGCSARYAHDTATQLVANGLRPKYDNTTDAICFICYAEHRASGRILSEGRGAAQLRQHQDSVNTTIKMAKKRALVDCALGFGVSDVFTQDIESAADYGSPGKVVPEGVEIEFGPFGGVMVEILSEKPGGKEGTRRVFTVRGQPDNYRFVTYSNIDRYKRDVHRNAGEGRAFTCDINDMKTEGDLVYFRCQTLRHPLAAGAITVNGFDWEAEQAVEPAPPAAEEAPAEAPTAPEPPPSSMPPEQAREEALAAMAELREAHPEDKAGVEKAIGELKIKRVGSGPLAQCRDVAALLALAGEVRELVEDMF